MMRSGAVVLSLLAGITACERTMVRTGPLASVADSLFPQPMRKECRPNPIELDPSVRSPLDCVRRVGSFLYTVYQDGAGGKVTYVSLAVVNDSIARRQLLEQLRGRLTNELGAPRQTCDSEFAYRGLEWSGKGYIVHLTIAPTERHVLLSYHLGQRGHMPYCKAEGEIQRR